MKVISRPTLVALLLLIALTTTTVAQQKRQTPAKPQPKPAAAPAPTFDTLVPSESYAIYGEVRSVGNLIRSNVVNETLEPILKLAGPPKEFRTLVKWLNAHADDVMSSRMLVATWPMAPDLPEVLIAIEFASPEEAAKLAAPLNQFLPTLLPPVPDPSPESKGENPKAAPAPLKPAYHLQQTGSLIVLTPTPLKTMKRGRSKPLAEDINFRAARNRFTSEPLFVYIDIKLMERQEEERKKQAEKQRQETEQLQQKEKAEEQTEPKKGDGLSTQELTEEEKAAVPEMEEAVLTAETSKDAVIPDPVLTSLTMIGSSLFSGASKWPDGIGLALAFENDSFDVRALFVNQPGEKSDIVPFMPVLIPGPPMVPDAPNVLPADTELFATMSLDLSQIYLTMSKPRPNATYYTSRGNVRTEHEEVFESPFAAIEKKLKMNLKDDILPLLGSEIALRLPVTNMDVLGLPKGPAPTQDTKEKPVSQQEAAKVGPAILISVKDKEAVRALLPKIVDALGFKGANAFAQTERKEDTEIVSYVDYLSYAFVGNFLVLASDPATTRHIVDSYLKHETLAVESNFKTFTRWQPRPAHGQLYISPALMESYKTWAEQPRTGLSDEARVFLMRVAASAQPITYSLSNEGFGPLHELHLPKNLVLMAVAGISNGTNPTPVQRNEGMTMGLMHMIAHSEGRYKAEKGAAGYVTLEQLIEAKMISKEMIENSGYKFEMTVTGDKFELYAVPLEYGKTGNMSYFIDQTLVLRGADRSGASATSSDPPIH